VLESDVQSGHVYHRVSNIACKYRWTQSVTIHYGQFIIF